MYIVDRDIPIAASPFEYLCMSLNRHVGIDLLRIIAALGVVFVHVSSPFVIKNMKMINDLFWAGNLFDSIGRLSVPAFVIVSGYFIIKPTDNLRVFYSKRFTRILYPFISWSVIYLFWAFFFDETRTSKIWEGLLWGKPYFHLWFLGMLMGLYAVAPLLADLKKRVSTTSFLKLSLVALLLGMAIESWNAYAGARTWVGTWWLSYVGYFMIGASLSEFRNLAGKQFLLLTTVLISVLSIFLLTGWLFAHKDYNWYFYNYLGLPVAVGSISLVLLFINLKIAGYSVISKLSELSFGIYLIHMIPLNIIKRHWNGMLIDNPYGNILLISLVVFTLSGLVAWGISKIKPLSRILI